MTAPTTTTTTTTTTTATTTRFQLRPIDPHDADRLRARAAATAVLFADVHPGYPCRQCLRDADVGDELVLVSYDPFTIDSPYRSASPIFLHRTPCRPPSDLRALPRQLTRRLLSVRAFDVRALMVDAAVVAGDGLVALLDRFFADERVDHVHVHNAERGCWAVRADRRAA